MATDKLLEDIKLSRRSFDAQVSDRDAVDLIPSASGDLKMVSGTANLAQAIINRLLTHKGELGSLGHPDYGSRLHRLIGEPNDVRTRSLAELYVRESLSAERRIEKITGISFSGAGGKPERDTLTITVSIKPLSNETDLTLTIPLRLGGSS